MDRFCEACIHSVNCMRSDVDPKTGSVLMRSSQAARLGQEKPHETQAPHSRVDYQQAMQFIAADRSI